MKESQDWIYCSQKNQKLLKTSTTGKNDHILLEFGIGEGMEEGRKEHSRKGRQNYSKTNFTELREYFEEIDWVKSDKAKGVEEK